MSAPVWATENDLGSFGASKPIIPIQLTAIPVPPSTSVTYTIYGNVGGLPLGLTLATNGVITGTPDPAQIGATLTFTVRATDNFGNTNNRTFTMSIIGSPPEWVTPEGVLGTYTALQNMSVTIQANPVYPSSTVTYSLVEGALPIGLKISKTGIISGIPTSVKLTNTSEFSIVAKDDKGNISKRTFSLIITNPSPNWITPSGTIGTFPAQVAISPTIKVKAVPVASNGVYVTYKLLSGNLPPGVTFTSEIDAPLTVLIAKNSNSANNTIKLGLGYTTAAFVPNRPVKFTGSVFGGVTSGTIYYIKQIISDTEFTISATLNGPVKTLTTASGTMFVTLLETFAGVISGTPTEVEQSVTYQFVIRATDNFGYIKDRFFSMTISGNLAPTFTTPEGLLFSTNDSIWKEYKIEYSNPDPNNIVIITLVNGQLPPGLEINEVGLIRGYADKPVVEQTLEELSAVATGTNTTNNSIICLTTADFTVGRPIIFSGTVLGGLVTGTTYYIKDILSINSFTVSTSPNGSVYLLNNDAGIMNCLLPQTTAGNPITKIYSFTLKINSKLGEQLRTYSIKVINQNASVADGGPGYIGNCRVPVLYNTRPFTYNIDKDVSNYGFYVLPPITQIQYPGQTYSDTQNAFVGTFYSNNYFAFKMLGYDFDFEPIEFLYDIPPALGLTADPYTGWIRGNLTIPLDTLSEYVFSVAVKKRNSSIVSNFTKFNFFLSNNIDGEVTWITDADLGTIYNGTPSTLQLLAACDVSLKYVKTSGSLPPNLQLLENGKIIGTVAFETTEDYIAKNELTPYTFTVRAYSDISPNVIVSERTFTLNVKQEFIKPTDTLYIECTPSLADRAMIYDLIGNTATSSNLIPRSYLYRTDDPNFGLATNVTYAHAYGIYASDLPEYIEAIKEKNHYWRNVTLGEIRTAYARNDKNEIIYEVVYSEIIDNLVDKNVVTVYAGNFIPGKAYTIKYVGTTNFTTIGAPNNQIGTIFTATGKGSGTGSATTITKTTSVSEQIGWPRVIDLNFGPWYTSITDIYTSYIGSVELDLMTQKALFYIETQENQYIATNQGSPTFFTSLTPGYVRTLYPNSLENMRKRVEQNLGVDRNAALLPLWMTSQQKDGNTLGFTPAWVIAYTLPVKITPDGPMTYAEAELAGYASSPSYAETIADNITNHWKDPAGNILKLNLVNFQIDRFTVNKVLTYNYDNAFSPPAWLDLPSATPVPNPIDSKNFYALFPRKTILPNIPFYPYIEKR